MNGEPVSLLERLLGLSRQPRAILDEAYSEADRVLDFGQGQVFRLICYFIPVPIIARDLRFQQLLASRFLSDAGQQAVAYGALIEVVRSGGSAFDAALIGIAALIGPACLGLHGGAIADALPKRVALATAYNLQALLCFVGPALFGTDLAALAFLVLAVNVLAQVSSPSESSVLPLVATEAELASAVSLVNLASAGGAGFGTALLAPLLVRAFGVETLFYVAGGMLLLAASRVFDLPTAEKRRRVIRAVSKVRLRYVFAWLFRQPALNTMLFVGVVAATANTVLQTLAPRYVQSVLGADAADTVYIFAPSAVGLVAALVVAPYIMTLLGERRATLVGFATVALALTLLGAIDSASAVFDPINPLRALGRIGIDLSVPLRTAALLAIPTGFGVALAATCVQTYINRRVPVRYQGRTFALQGSIKSGASIAALLSLGGVASAIGVEKVLLVSPALLFLLALALVMTSIRFAGIAPVMGLRVLRTFWDEPAV